MVSPAGDRQEEGGGIVNEIDQLRARLDAIEAALKAPSRRIDPDRIYRVAEAAELLACGTSTIYELADSRALAVTRVAAGGRGLRILGRDLLDFLDSRKSGGPEPKMNFKRLGL